MTDTLLNQQHPPQTALYTGARALERAAYYGIRSILTLYMVHSLGIEEGIASQRYGWFVAAAIVLQIVGALLGDLLLGTCSCKCNPNNWSNSNNSCYYSCCNYHSKYTSGKTFYKIASR